MNRTTLRHILVLDNDPAVRELSALFAAHGYVLTCVEHGIEAITLFEQRPFDLIIIELLLDHHDGFDTFVKLHSTGSPPKIVVTTRANDKRGDIYLKIASRLGADEALPKPILPEHLLAVVQRILN